MVSPYADFIKKLHRDKAFRQAFADDPRGVLRASGLDPDLLDLPSKIDLDALERRIDAQISSAPPDAATLRHASAQELWDKFNFIRVNYDLASPSIPATSIIYGTTATTSVISLVTAQGSAARTDVELARLGRLRKLTRLPARALSFAVSGPDGRSLHGLGIEAIKALVGRLR